MRLPDRGEGCLLALRLDHGLMGGLECAEVVHCGLRCGERSWLLEHQFAIEADDVVDGTASLDASEEAHGLVAIVGVADVESLVKASREGAGLRVDGETSAVDRSQVRELAGCVRLS